MSSAAPWRPQSGTLQQACVDWSELLLAQGSAAYAGIKFANVRLRSANNLDWLHMHDTDSQFTLACEWIVSACP